MWNGIRDSSSFFIRLVMKIEYTQIKYPGALFKQMAIKISLVAQGCQRDYRMFHKENRHWKTNLKTFNQSKNLEWKEWSWKAVKKEIEKPLRNGKETDVKSMKRTEKGGPRVWQLWFGVLGAVSLLAARNFENRVVGLQHIRAWIRGLPDEFP